MNAYARAPMDNYQDGPGAPPPPDDDGWDAALERRQRADAIGGMMRRGLTRWLWVVATGSLVAVVLGHPDAALLLVLAAQFALAGSWDTRDRARTGDPDSDRALEPGLLGALLRVLVPMLVPLSGTLLFAAMGGYARTLGHTGAHLMATQWCAAAAAICMVSAFPPVAQVLANALMPREQPGHTTRLTATLALVLLLLPVPARLLMPDFLRYLRESGQPLVDAGGLSVQLLGEVMFAFAAVRLWVGRDWATARARLGLDRMGPREAAVAVIGLGAVMGVNAGMEWTERLHFPALWDQDQQMGRMIAGELSLATALVLGVSAGVGEEMMVRGALQPRVGLVWASLLFACGHVQYTWFGMLTIALLGVTLGIVRQRTNTTTAIVVHVLYDIIAALGT